MAREMVINANEVEAGRSYGHPWGLPLEYANWSTGTAWQSYVGGYRATFSGDTSVGVDEDNVLVSFSADLDGTFSLSSFNSAGEPVVVATGTMPSFSYDSNLTNGDFAQPEGDGTYRLLIHGSPSPPAPPLGPFGEFVSSLDRIVYNGSSAANEFEATYLETDTVMHGGDGSDYLWGAFRHSNQLFGDGGDDNIQGQGIDDTLDGGAGNDFVFDADGNGDGTIQEGPQDFYSHDTLLGGAGNDQVLSTGGGDFLDGGSGDDYLQAGQGLPGQALRTDDNTLVGGAGNDTIFGGAGTDTAVYGGTRSQYEVTPLNFGGGSFFRVLGPDGDDQISQVDFLRFDDGTFAIGDLGNQTPVISSNGGASTAEVDVSENTTAVTTVTASDAEGDDLVYSISGGSDSNLFTIDSAAGVLSFLSAPDFENPNSNGGEMDQFYDVQVRATDAAGAFDEQLITVSVSDLVETIGTAGTPDLTASSDSGASETDNLTNGASLSFAVTLSGGRSGDIVELLADGSPFAVPVTHVLTGDEVSAGVATLSGLSLPEGTTAVSARVGDGSGNFGVASSSLEVTVDTIAPVTFNGIPPAATSNTGRVTFSPTTNENNVTFQGSLDGAAFTPLTANSVGEITLTGLSEGQHVLEFRGVDVAGNVDASPLSFDILVDLTAPGAPAAPDLPTASDSGASSTDNMTNDTTPAIAGTAEAGASVVVRYTGPDGTTGTLGPVNTATDGFWSTTTPEALADGTYAFTASATDVAGNTSAASPSLTVTVDTAAPLAPTIASQTTSDITPTVTGTAETGSQVSLFAADGTTLLGQSTAGTDGTWSVELAEGSLASGANTLKASATDAAGNTGALVTTTVTFADDQSAPTVTVTSDDAALNIGDSALVTFQFSEAVTGFAVEDLALSNLAVTGNSFTTLDADTYQVIVGPAAAFDGDGTLSVGTGYTDLVGNTGVGQSLTFDVDTIAPETPLITPAGGPTTDTTPDISGTAEAGATVKLYNGTQLLGEDVAGANGVWTITAAQLVTGTYTLGAAATDAAGNAGSSATTSLTIAGATGVTITGTSRADVISGTTGPSGQPRASGGDDTIYGLGGKDTISGLGGNDRIDGGSEADAINGGDGDDTVVIRGTEGQNDVVRAGETAEVNGDTLELAADSTLGGFNAATSQVEILQGNGFTLSGTGGDELFDLRTLSAVQNVGALDAGAGADTVFGSGFADTLRGGNGRDSLNGGAGNDRMDGGNGDDVINGGDGDDTVLIRGTEGRNDVVRGGEASETLGDTLELAADSTLSGFNAATCQIEILRGNGFSLAGTGSDELFDLRSLSAVDSLRSLDAGAGADTVFGSAFADTLRGENGNDRLNGGTGNDELAGGQGSDTFVFVADGTGAARDRIADFGDARNNEDVIDLSAFGPLSQGQFAAWKASHVALSGGNVTITLSDDTITLVGVTNVGAIDYADFRF